MCCMFFLFATMFLQFQGGLDVMYLKNRYEQGKAKVEEKLIDCHDFTSHRTITLSHGDVVQKQAKLGQSAFLISTALGLIQDCHHLV